MVIAGLSAYLSSDPEFIPAIHGGNIYHRNPRVADEAAIKTAAVYAVVVSLVSCHRKGISFVPAETDDSFLENLFRMMGLVDPNTRRPDARVLSVFRKGLVLNCDNGMTQSNLVLCATASSLCDPISCLISAVSAAYGPLHYGAQEAGYRTLKEIGTPERVPEFLEQVKRRERRLFGYGHRTFASEDPRLSAVKGWLEELNFSSEQEPLMKVAEEIDRLAAQDDYFKSRGLRANADFYTLFVFRAYGFDWEMIGAANFCMRIIGFMAHWREAMGKLHPRVSPPSF
jgi:citrate synthase